MNSDFMLPKHVNYDFALVVESVDSNTRIECCVALRVPIRLDDLLSGRNRSAVNIEAGCYWVLIGSVDWV